MRTRDGFLILGWTPETGRVYLLNPEYAWTWWKKSTRPLIEIGPPDDEPELFAKMEIDNFIGG